MGWIIFKYAAGLGDSAECVCTRLITSWRSALVSVFDRFLDFNLNTYPSLQDIWSVLTQSIHSIDEELPNLALIQKWNYCCDPVLETPDIGPWWDLMTWPGYLQYRGHSPSPLSLYYSVLCLCATQYFVTVFFRTLARAWHVAKLTFAQLSTSSCDKCCCDTDLGQVSAA